MIVDIVILVIVVAAVLIGRYRGLILCLVNVAILIASMVLALMFYKPVASFIIENTKIDDSIHDTIKQTIHVEDIDLASSTLSTLPKPVAEYISQANNSINETKDNVSEDLANQITEQVINGLSYLLILVVVRIIAVILKIVAKIINKLPGLKEVNHLGGAICGFVQGVIIVYVTLAIISVIAPMLQGSRLLTEINESYIGKIMYNNNILISLVNK